MHVWFSVTPIGTASGSVSREVARAVEAARATGARCETGPSGTVVEGTWDECMVALRAAGEAVLERAPRVSFTAKFDMRTDQPTQTAADKMTSLRRALEERDLT